MDEDDVREEEESRALKTAIEFAGFGTESDSIRKITAIDIFRTLDETVGSKLLKRMGWREGQGIGPRVRRATKDEEENDERSAETHLFAPDDVQIISLTRKTDHKGLGYDGELQAREQPTRSSSPAARKAVAMSHSSDEEQVGVPYEVGSRKKARSRKKTGFGVGILNDNGSDDEDPYSIGPKVSYNRTLGGERRSKSKANGLGSTANPLLKNKPTFMSKRLANLKGVLRKCHDGRLPPDGFILADELDSFGTMSLQEDKYKPPEVPEGWKSARSRDVEADASSGFISTADAAKASSLTAQSRASLLGEPQLPGKSIFDFLTPAARDRLATASGRQDLPAAGNAAGPNSHQRGLSAKESLQPLVPQLDREIAIQALDRGTGGWMPYAEDEDKRTRYRTYLEIQAGLRSSDELPARAEHMKQDDWVLEMHEFARAAEVFKPISGLMASRFTSSTSLPHDQDGKPSEASVDSLLSNPKGKPADPAEAAASLGIFGPMTRSISNFYPTRLVCKRFNVPMPLPEENGTTSGHASNAPKPKLAATQFRSFSSVGFQHDITSEPKNRAPPSQQSIVSSRENEPEMQDPDRNDALEQEKPGKAVFRAIFGSDDETD